MCFTLLEMRDGLNWVLIVILIKDEHPWKELFAIEVTDTGRTIEVICEQSANALSEIVVMVSGSSILARSEHPLKHLGGITLTLGGIMNTPESFDDSDAELLGTTLMDLRDEQSANAPSEISSIESGSSTVFNKEQLKKNSTGISVVFWCSLICTTVVGRRDGLNLIPVVMLVREEHPRNAPGDMYSTLSGISISTSD